MEYGYARVSTREQNEQRQILALTDFGILKKTHSIMCMLLCKLKFIEVSLQFLYLANSPMIQQSCRPQP